LAGADQREKALIRGIPSSLAEVMNRRGVEVIRERGRFVGSNAVAVDGETLEAKHIVIATAQNRSGCRSAAPN
jgi:glutathione reductase (NADPH)